MAENRHFLKAIVGTVIGAILGGGFALMGVYYSAKLGQESDITLKRIQMQKQLYGQLLGQREVRTHLYKSYVQSSLDVDYYQILWENAAKGSDKKSLYLQQATFFQNLQSNLILKIAENESRFYEILGETWVYFPNTSELSSLIKPLYLQKQLPLPSLEELKGKKLTQHELENWHTESIKEGKDFVEKEYGKRIDYLVEYLKKTIDGETSP